MQEISVYVNIVLCILSFLLAAISVIIVIITIKQNNKMIEASNRPYVVAYTDATYIDVTRYYIVVKNFGNSGATITKFECNFDLSRCAFDKDRIPFSKLKNTFIAPQQSFTSVINNIELYKNTDSLTFYIEYTDGIKKYSDTIKIDLTATEDLLHMNAANNKTKNPELENISLTLQNILEKSL